MIQTLISLICVHFSIQGDQIGGNVQKDCVESCKEGEQERMGNHCYYWSTVTKKWDNAENHCISNGGHLAAITSLKMHNFLQKKVNAGDTKTWYWIGGSDKGQEGNWTWIDGSVWDFTIWGNQPRGQQPRGGFNHDCLQIYNHHYAQNGWNDHRCDYYYPFICSWRICPGSNK